MDRQKLKENFKEYTDGYDISDTKIRLKVEHTYRVAMFCDEIAKSLDLKQPEIDLAWVCGMLHDIGRFEQIKRYGTFMDALSIDHAKFGADLLFLEGLYDKLVPDDGAMDKKEIIEKAIRVHNTFRIPDELSDEEKMYANILRDADKIDILRVISETPMEEMYNVSTAELKNAVVSEDVKKAFLEKRCAKRHDRTSAIDYLVGHICLSFELVYEKSRELVKEQGYLYRLLQFESDIKETNDWFEYMRQTLGFKAQSAEKG